MLSLLFVLMSCGKEAKISRKVDVDAVKNSPKPEKPVVKPIPSQPTPTPKPVVTSSKGDIELVLLNSLKDEKAFGLSKYITGDTSYNLTDPYLIGYSFNKKIIVSQLNNENAAEIALGIADAFKTIEATAADNEQIFEIYMSASEILDLFTMVSSKISATNLDIISFIDRYILLNNPVTLGNQLYDNNLINDLSVAKQLILREVLGSANDYAFYRSRVRSLISYFLEVSKYDVAQANAILEVILNASSLRTARQEQGYSFTLYKTLMFPFHAEGMAKLKENREDIVKKKMALSSPDSIVGESIAIFIDTRI